MTILSIALVECIYPATKCRDVIAGQQAMQIWIACMTKHLNISPRENQAFQNGRALAPLSGTEFIFSTMLSQDRLTVHLTGMSSEW